jgi:hypothetical protein
MASNPFPNNQVWNRSTRNLQHIHRVGNYQSLDWVPLPIVIPEEQEVDTKKKEEDGFWIISWK